MLDHELRALVSVEPAADFQARIRTRVGSEPARRPWFGAVVVKAALAPAAIAVAAFAVLYWFAGPRSSSPPPAALLSSGHPGFALVPARPPIVVQPPLSASGADRRAPRSSMQAVVRVQLDRAETRALQRLFSLPIPVAIVDQAKPVEVPELTIPSLLIVPVVVDGRSEGERR
jgi:hypothetical protein